MEWVWTKEEVAKAPTKEWRSINLKNYDTSPLTEGDLFGEGNTIHEFARIIRRVKEITGTPQVSDWTELIKRSFEPKKHLYDSINGTKVRNTSIRMAMSDPEILFTGAVWKDNKLLKRTDTVIWKAVYIVFGAPWKANGGLKRTTHDEETSPNKRPLSTATATTMDTPIPLPPETTTTTDTLGTSERDSPKSTTSRAEAHIDSTTPQADEEGVAPPTTTLLPPVKLFLSKTPKKKTSEVTLSLIDDALKRKYLTFFTVKLPTITRDTTLEQNNEFVTYFNVLLRELMSIDSKIVLHTWNEDKDTKPLTRNSALPATIDLLKEYTDKAWMSKGKDSWFRIRLGHEKRSETLREKRSWFRKNNYVFKADDLQVKESAIACWLLGSHPSMICTDLAEAISRHPSMKDIPIAVKIQPIRMSPWGSIPKKEQVKAAHVYTDYHMVYKCKTALKQVYSTTVEDLGFPLGIPLRVVPHVADGRYRGNSVTEQNCKRLKNKQANFLKNVKTQRNAYVQCIDFATKDGTLRDIVMRMETKQVVEGLSKNLFISIEESMNSRDVTYIYRKEYDAQASSTISAMPLILEAHYGPRSGNWIAPGAMTEMAGWTYDIATGTIKSADDDYTAKIIDDWKADGDDEIEQGPEIIIIIGANNRDNNHFDAGSVLTAHSDSDYSSSSNEEPDYHRMVKKLTRLMTSVTPDQKQNLQSILNGKSSDSDENGGQPDE